MSRPVIIPDLAKKRPATRREARELIIRVYRENRWDADEQERHQAGLGLAPAPLSDRPNEEMKVILDDLEKARMILYRE